MTKNNLEEKDFLADIFKSQSFMGKPGQGLKQQEWSRASLKVALHDLLRLIPCSTRDHQSSGGTAHSEMAPSTQSRNQDITPHTCLWANLMEAVSLFFFFLEYPVSG